MNNKYFNNFEFMQAVNLQYSNPFKARELLEDYFDKYPNDYSAYPFYISVLVSLNEIEKAKKIYDDLEKKYIINNQYDNNRRFEYFKYGMFICKIKLYFQMGKYEEIMAYDDYIENNFYEELHSILFYCMKMTNKLDTSKRYDKSYLFRQLMEYRESEFRDHINKHLLLANNNYNSSIFISDFPIDKVICEVKKYIPNDKKILSGFIADFYYFRYDDCGKSNYKYTDYFKVICINNTGNIITMCPCVDGNELPYIDLNYLKEKENNKIKTLSQIDKFNQRYNKK